MSKIAECIVCSVPLIIRGRVRWWDIEELVCAQCGDSEYGEESGEEVRSGREI